MFYETINKIKNGYHHNLIKYKINLNKKEFNLIRIFLKMGILKNVIKKKNVYYVNYSYDNCFKKKFLIINIFKPSNKKFIKSNLLKKLTLKKNWILILSTNKGVITSTEAVKYNIGGLIIAKIWN